METAVLTSLNDWTEALERNKRTDVIYFDKKAFDKVPCGKLLDKLKLVGIHPVIVTWIANFLSNRTYQVRVRNKFSSVYRAQSGLP